jgi:hypothetical protein
MRTPRHYSHAGIRLVKVRQAIADFDAHQRQVLVPEIARDPNIAVPAAPEWFGIGILRPLVNERRRVKVNIGAHQLNDQRYCRGIGDEVEQGFLAEEARAEIDMVVLGPVEEPGFVEERLSQTVAGFEQPLNGFAAKGPRDYQKAVFVKRLSLLLSEANEIQRDSLSLRKLFAAALRRQTCR